MKQDMKEFMAKVSEDEGLRVKLEALAGLPEDEVAARMGPPARLQRPSRARPVSRWRSRISTPPKRSSTRASLLPCPAAP